VAIFSFLVLGSLCFQRRPAYLLSFEGATSIFFSLLTSTALSEKHALRQAERSEEAPIHPP
jgi:hypothetical protein